MRSNRRAITDDVDASPPPLLESGATGAGAGAGAGAGGGAEVNGGEDEETYVEEALDDDELEELEACNMERDALENDDLGRDALPDTADAFEGVAAEEAAEAFEGVEVEEACAEYSAFPDNMPLIMAAASGVSAAARGQH